MQARHHRDSRRGVPTWWESRPGANDAFGHLWLGADEVPLGPLAIRRPYRLSTSDGGLRCLVVHS
jgi:hypothetical protein